MSRPGNRYNEGNWCFLPGHSSFVLTEAGLMVFFGGVIGLAFSYGASWVINHFGADYIGGGMMGGQGYYLPYSSWLAIFALIFSILIGVVAGIYPANRAVKLSPISAIRNE